MNNRTKFSTISLIAIILTLGFLAPSTHADRAGRILDRLDDDGDGMISQAEFQTRRKTWLQRMDTDDNGAVSLEEVRLHLETRHAAMQEKLEKKFLAADTNDDGQVTHDEMRLAAFNKIDKDEDGFLTEAEFRKAKRHGKMFRRHGGHGDHGEADPHDDQ